MASQWYFRKHDRNFGPITSQVLRQLTEAGMIEPEDLVRKKGIHKWSQAKFVKNLYGAGIGTLPEMGKEPAGIEPYVEYADAGQDAPLAQVVSGGTAPPNPDDPFAALLGQTAPANQPASAQPVALEEEPQEQIPQAAAVAPTTSAAGPNPAAVPGAAKPPGQVPHIQAARRLRSAKASSERMPRLATSVFAGSASQIVPTPAAAPAPAPQPVEPHNDDQDISAEESVAIEETSSNLPLKGLLFAAIAVMLLGIGFIIYLLVNRPAQPPVGSAGEPNQPVETCGAAGSRPSSR